MAWYTDEPAVSTVAHLQVILRYHNDRMLATVDLNAVVRLLMDSFGSPLCLRLEAMSEAEREETIERVDGLRAVRERFRIFEVSSDGQLRRRPDLEEKAVREGRK